MYTSFLSGDNLVNVTFTEEEDVKEMQANLVAVSEHVHKPILAGKIVALHKATTWTTSTEISLQLSTEKINLIEKLYRWRDSVGLEDECLWWRSPNTAQSRSTIGGSGIRPVRPRGGHRYSPFRV